MKQFFTLLLLCVAVLSLQAKQYCHEALKQGDNTIYLTCQKISDGNYQMKIEADVDLIGLGGSFCHVNGTEPYQLNADGHFAISADKRTITCDIQSTSAPVIYTPLYVLMPGEVNFGQPADIEWGTCDGSGNGNQGGNEGGEGNEGETDKPDQPEDIWTDFLGDGAGEGKYTNLYKVEKVDGLNVINIQNAPKAGVAAIYIAFPAAPIVDCNVASEVEGAGIWLFLTAFTLKETTVTLKAGDKQYTFRVWYKNGIDTTSLDVTPQNNQSVARKVMIDGQIYILRDGVRYNIFGLRQ